MAHTEPDPAMKMPARSKALLDEIERVAKAIGRKPRYVTFLCGYGGRLYARLLKGGRIYDETEEIVRAKLLTIEADFKARQESSDQAA